MKILGIANTVLEKNIISKSKSQKKLLQNKFYQERMNHIVGNINENSFISDIDDEESPIRKLLSSKIFVNIENDKQPNKSIILKKLSGKPLDLNKQTNGENTNNSVEKVSGRRALALSIQSQKKI